MDYSHNEPPTLPGLLLLIIILVAIIILFKNL